MRRGTRRALAAPTAAASRGRAGARGRTGARGRPGCPRLPSGWGRPPGTHPRGSDSAGTGGRAGGGQQRQHHTHSVPTLADPARETPRAYPQPCSAGGDTNPAVRPPLPARVSPRRQRGDPIPGHSPATPVPCRPPGPRHPPVYRLGSVRPGPARRVRREGAGRPRGAGRGGAGGAHRDTHTCVGAHTGEQTRGHPHTNAHAHRRAPIRTHTHHPRPVLPPLWLGVTLTGIPMVTAAAPGAELRMPSSAHLWLSTRVVAGLPTRRDRHLPARVWETVPRGAGAVPGVLGTGPAPRSAAAQMSGPSPARSKQNSSAASHFPAAAAKNSKCRVVPATGPRVPRRAGLGAGGNTSCLGDHTCLLLPSLTVPACGCRSPGGQVQSEWGGRGAGRQGCRQVQGERGARSG